MKKLFISCPMKGRTKASNSRQLNNQTRRRKPCGIAIGGEETLWFDSKAAVQTLHI